jgi:hypothetical protein
LKALSVQLREALDENKRLQKRLKAFEETNARRLGPMRILRFVATELSKGTTVEELEERFRKTLGAKVK